MKLTDKLKKDHKDIATALEKIRELGIVNSEAKKALYSVKNSLLEHLETENRELYPVLRKAAESNPKLRGTLDIFAKDMEQVTQAALEFFQKYSASEEKGLEFAKDFGRLFAALGERIRKEESTLYAEFDRLNR